MGWFEALVLGVVQGLTEFLPISSNAHLRLTAAFAGWNDPGAAFTAVSQLGTETAVLVYFRKDIGGIIRAWSISLMRKEYRTDPRARMGWYVILGTIPIGVLGLLLKDSIDSAFRDLRVIAGTLIGFAIILGLADRYARNKRTLEHLTPRHAVGYGLAQSLALLPGVSRSGGTISAGLLLGYRRDAAARYSFLLAVPAVFASGLYELRDIGGNDSPAWGPTMLATAIAFVVGFVVISWFLRFISYHTFAGFVRYRIVLGVLVIALVAVGAVDPGAAAAD